LAKELGLSSKDIIKTIEEFGINIHNHMSTLEDNEVEIIKEFYAPVEIVPALLDPKLEQVILEEKGGIEKIKPKKNFNQNEEKAKLNFNKKDNKKQAVKEESNKVEIEETITVGDLAKSLGKSLNEIIMKLMKMNIMASINQSLDFETASLIGMEYGIEVVREKTQEQLDELEFEFIDNPDDLIQRAPIVTVMGHVDHGKTSLLDAIRDTNVTRGEAGGITQHIGASEIMVKDQKIVFLDTPGHEAFTSLRARGAKVTDMAILVVAADDGVKPQTIEAIDHAKAANVPIIVAINKMDKPAANPDKVKQELADRGVLVEDWGGEVVSVPVSAHSGQGIETLLEMILIVSEMLDLKANPNRPGIGTIIEAKLDKARGPVSTIIVQNGSIEVGDPIFAGKSYGKVRAMFNDKGKSVRKAGPSSTVEILGLNDVPTSGDKLYKTRDEKSSRMHAEKNVSVERLEVMRNSSKNITLDDLFDKIKQGEIKDLNIILKADVNGSIEALKQSLNKLGNEEVRVNIIHASVGAITESDIMLASASNAIIIGFNVRPASNVEFMREKEKVELRTYRIIYEAIKDVKDALSGLLDPEYKEVVEGKIEVRATFKVPNIGTIAGAYVKEGKVTRKSSIRLVREGIVIFEGKLSSLKRFKDDAKEVNAGFECGIGLENYNDLKEGDILESFIIQEIKRSL
jgi:translation initiation factor IF-2